MARMTGHQMADSMRAGSWNLQPVCGDTSAILSMGGVISYFPTAVA